VGRYVLRRVLQVVPALFVTSIIVFLMLHLTPGDPAYAILGLDATPQAIAALRTRMGFDQPLAVQYALWLKQLLHGDLGESFVSGSPVWTLIWMKFPATVELSTSALLIAILIALPGGLLSALRHKSGVDYTVTGFNAVALSVPTFWLGILLVMGVSLRLGWLPPSDRVPFLENPLGSLRHLLLPAVTLGIPISAALSRFLRTAVLEVINREYVRTARAKGLHESAILYRHALRNALIPVVTALGILMGQLLGGSVVVETVFDWPGLGRLMLISVLNKDFTVVQGTILFVVVIFVTINLLTDTLYAFLDPRVRYTNH
jgi:peptide/nickel transport system permease protein